MDFFGADQMKSRLALDVAALLALVGVPAKAATVLPIVNIGGSFSGSFNINPATPDTCGICYGGTGTSIGEIATQIGGKAFSAPVDAIFVVPGTDTTWRWYLQSSHVVVDGTPLEVNSAMSIALYGSTTSASILPLPLSSYSSAIFQIGAYTSDLKSWGYYIGYINSLIQIDSSGIFAFSAIIRFRQRRWPSSDCRPRTLNMGDDDPRLRWRWLHGLSPVAQRSGRRARRLIEPIYDA